ncbi:unnamed protein product [Amoebophrya sp. A25]|nr:unnamed protein product [Amoebophrya sp. A25]|eukprot:GSA25T00009116001.1
MAGLQLISRGKLYEGKILYYRGHRKISLSASTRHPYLTAALQRVSPVQQGIDDTSKESEHAILIGGRKNEASSSYIDGVLWVPEGQGLTPPMLTQLADEGLAKDAFLTTLDASSQGGNGGTCIQTRWDLPQRPFLKARQRGSSWIKIKKMLKLQSLARVFHKNGTHCLRHLYLVLLPKQGPRKDGWHFCTITGPAVAAETRNSCGTTTRSCPHDRSKGTSYSTQKSASKSASFKASGNTSSEAS